MDTKFGKNFKLRKVYEPWEMVGIDMLEISKRKRIVVMIDYLSRYVCAKLLKNKKAEQVLGCIKSFYEKFKFKKLLADNGKKFKNSLCEEWCKQKNIELEFSVPYYHASNGRVERVNRTLREMIKRSKGPIKETLERIVQSYNTSMHRGINMSPEEALKIENYNKVIEQQEIYANGFIKCRGKYDVLKTGDRFLIKMNLRNRKWIKNLTNMVSL
jgi:hypothetical protein